MKYMNLLEQSLAQSKSSMSVSASALQATPCIQVPQLVFPVSSLEISDTELANPAIDVSCNLGCAPSVSFLSGSKLQHQQNKRVLATQ